MKLSVLAGSALLGSALAVDPIVIQVFLFFPWLPGLSDQIGLQILLLQQQHSIVSILHQHFAGFTLS